MTLGEARELARSLFLGTLPALQVGPRLRQIVRIQDRTLVVAGDRYPLHPGRPVRVVSIGKIAIEMAHALPDILAGVRLQGVVSAPEIPPTRAAGFEYFAAGHPYPNEQSWQAAEEVLSLLDRKSLSADDLVLFLVSGGGSAMLEMPIGLPRGFPELPVKLEDTLRDTLEDLRRFYNTLVTCGASIAEINVVRKHFSAVKGGRLAQAALPARQITLYVSDVPDHFPSMVASGPTMPDESTLEECSRVLSQYGLRGKIPNNFVELFGYLPETPKPGDPCFAQSRYHCLLSNTDAVETLAKLARSNGIHAQNDSSCDDWEFRRAADYLLGRLEKFRREHPGRPAALVSGGELSCAVAGDGMGGRNQAFVLYCATKIAGKPFVVLSGGTDGIDGNSPVCGAIADGTSAGRAAVLGLEAQDFLGRSDSYHFFEQLGDTLKTGPTGTNVRDLRILLAYA